MFAWKPKKNVFAREYVLKLIINGKLPFVLGLCIMIRHLYEGFLYIFYFLNIKNKAFVFSFKQLNKH